jgi:hypothetical protein
MPIKQKAKELRWQPKDQNDPYGYNRRPETHAGELVYCVKDTLKDFQKNKIYKIKAITKPNWSTKVKIEGIKGTHNWNSFDFIENNVALLRDYQINQVMDIDNQISTTIEGRKIDTMPNKEFVLTQMIMYNFQYKIGSVGDTPKSIGYHNFIATLVKKYSKYGVEVSDFEKIAEMPLKEIIEFFDF